jgi:outer membrane lipoprotein-sorting protein
MNIFRHFPKVIAAAIVAVLMLNVSAVETRAQSALVEKAGTSGISADIDPVIIQRTNAYFNGITGLSARFSQRNHEGRTARGGMVMLRPGRIFFQYDAPATMEIVADGRSLVVRDSRLKTQDLVPLSQTPLKFFLDRTVDLDASMNVLDAYRVAGHAIVTFEDTNTFAGRNMITLVFDSDIKTLKQWIILDSQGFETSVTLSDLRYHTSLDATLFVIDRQIIHSGGDN